MKIFNLLAFKCIMIIYNNNYEISKIFLFRIKFKVIKEINKEIL